jgi:integrase
MPTRINLTQAAANKLSSPASGRIIVWDRTLPGFGLRVAAPRPGSHDGRKTWIAMGRVDGKPVMETLGTLAQIPKVDKAREAARDALAQMKRGTKPLDERRAERESRATAEAAAFGIVAERFLISVGKAKSWAPKYAAEFRRILEHDVLPRWGERPIGTITKHDVNELLDAKAKGRGRTRKGTKGGAAIQANRTLTRLRTLFTWAKAHDLIDTDPTAGVLERGKERARDRFLTDDEIVWLWRGAEAAGWPFGPIFRLLLLTAQRESEVAGMRWSELNLDKRVWTIPRERAKSDRAHIVHLSALAVEVIDALPRLDEELVFPSRANTVISSFSKPKARLDAAMKAQAGGEIDGWVIHDLRRTATTVMARLNIAPHVVDKILNHSAGTIRGVAATYNRFLYLEERAAALEALGRFVESLVRPPEGNVVPLRLSK